jgi:hypothetical protein
LVVSTALCARDVGRAGGRFAAVPVAVLIAGGVYVYSFGGVVWPIAVAGAVALTSGRVRTWIDALPGLIVTGAIVILPSINQMARFAYSPFNHEVGEGNLKHALSAFEVLGVWFGYDFRWTPDPLWPTAIGVALAALAATVAFVRLMRAGEIALPAAIIPALGVFAYAAAAKSVYLSAKALTIAAPLVALAIATGLLLPAARRRWWPLGLAAVVAALAAFSSFLVLRDGRVGPLAHHAELARLRAHINPDRWVLFMPKEDMAQWDMVGLVAWQARNFYAPLVVAPRRARPAGANGFTDFDSFTPSTLDKFGYAITTNTPYQSRPPTNWHALAKTRSFILWHRRGPTPERYANDFGSTPARVLDCSTEFGRRRVSYAGPQGTALVLPQPIRGLPDAWQGEPGDAGESATMTLRVPRGRWDLSLAYAANTGLHVRAGGLRTDMPATIDRVGPYYLAGTLEQRQTGMVTITVTAKKLGWFGRLIGAHGHTRGLDTAFNAPLGGVALTRHHARGRIVPIQKACGRYVDHVLPPSS